LDPLKKLNGAPYRVAVDTKERLRNAVFWNPERSFLHMAFGSQELLMDSKSASIILFNISVTDLILPHY
jgi:hypothetical protein